MIQASASGQVAVQMRRPRPQEPSGGTGSAHTVYTVSLAAGSAAVAPPPAAPLAVPPHTVPPHAVLPPHATAELRHRLSRVNSEVAALRAAVVRAEGLARKGEMLRERYQAVQLAVQRAQAQLGEERRERSAAEAAGAAVAVGAAEAGGAGEAARAAAVHDALARVEVQLGEVVQELESEQRRSLELGEAILAEARAGRAAMGLCDHHEARLVALEEAAAAAAAAAQHGGPGRRVAEIEAHVSALHEGLAQLAVASGGRGGGGGQSAGDVEAAAAAVAEGERDRVEAALVASRNALHAAEAARAAEEERAARLAARRAELTDAEERNAAAVWALTRRADALAADREAEVVRLQGAAAAADAARGRRVGVLEAELRGVVARRDAARAAAESGAVEAEGEAARGALAARSEAARVALERQQAVNAEMQELIETSRAQLAAADGQLARLRAAVPEARARAAAARAVTARVHGGILALDARAELLCVRALARGDAAAAERAAGAADCAALADEVARMEQRRAAADAATGAVPARAARCEAALQRVRGLAGAARARRVAGAEAHAAALARAGAAARGGCDAASTGAALAAAGARAADAAVGLRRLAQAAPVVDAALVAADAARADYSRARERAELRRAHAAQWASAVAAHDRYSFARALLVRPCGAAEDGAGGGAGGGARPSYTEQLLLSHEPRPGSLGPEPSGLPAAPTSPLFGNSSAAAADAPPGARVGPLLAPPPAPLHARGERAVTQYAALM
jgi:hypothetical protein